MKAGLGLLLAAVLLAAAATDGAVTRGDVNGVRGGRLAHRFGTSYATGDLAGKARLAVFDRGVETDRARARAAAGRAGEVTPAEAAELIDEALSRLGDAGAGLRAEDFVMTKQWTGAGGQKVFAEFVHTHRGLPVYGSRVVIGADARTKELTSYAGLAVPAVRVADFVPAADRVAAPTEAAATVLFCADLFAASRANTRPEAVVGGGAMDCSIVHAGRKEGEKMIYFTDVRTGEKVFEIERGPSPAALRELADRAGAPAAMRRRNEVFNLTRVIVNGTQSVIYSEGDARPSGPQQLLELVDASKWTFDLFVNAAEFYSYDGQGSDLRMVFEYVYDGCPNAFWDGTSSWYCPGLASVDVIAHEFAHGYTEYTHGLIYQDQQGALNEAYSDIVAAVVEALYDDVYAGPDLSFREVGECTAWSEATYAIVPETIDMCSDLAQRWAKIAAMSDGRAIEVTGAQVVRLNTELCTVEGGDYSGATTVLVVDRGACAFADKQAAATAMGAAALIIVNNNPGEAPFSPGGITGGIPVAMVAYEDAFELDQASDLGASVDMADQDPLLDTSELWIVGEGTSIGAIRDMRAPNCFGHPAWVNDPLYWCAAGDNGGVHVNSGIVNHMYTLLVDGGEFNGQTIAALGHHKAFAVYLGAMMNYQDPYTEFSQHADALDAACADLIGVMVPDLVTGEPMYTITAENCGNVTAAATAVALRTGAPCAGALLLDPAAPTTTCANNLYAADFAAGAGTDWTTSEVPVFPDVWAGTMWSWASAAELEAAGVPDPASGGWFGPDPINGDCYANNQNGEQRLTSPAVVLDRDVTADDMVTVSFSHYFALETTYDGGIVEYQINDGDFMYVEFTDFLYNGYTYFLVPFTGGPWDNPLAGLPAFTGVNLNLAPGGGTSVIAIPGPLSAGDTITVRFNLGTDGCNGVIGWVIYDFAVDVCAPASCPACEECRAKKDNSKDNALGAALGVVSVLLLGAVIYIVFLHMARKKAAVVPMAPVS